jgi:hypothetical protein
MHLIGIEPMVPLGPQLTEPLRLRMRYDRSLPTAFSGIRTGSNLITERKPDGARAYPEEPLRRSRNARTA